MKRRRAVSFPCAGGSKLPPPPEKERGVAGVGESASLSLITISLERRRGSLLRRGFGLIREREEGGRMQNEDGEKTTKAE